MAIALFPFSLQRTPNVMSAKRCKRFRASYQFCFLPFCWRNTREEPWPLLKIVSYLTSALLFGSSGNPMTLLLFAVEPMVRRPAFCCTFFSRWSIGDRPSPDHRLDHLPCSSSGIAANILIHSHHNLPSHFPSAEQRLLLGGALLLQDVLMCHRPFLRELPKVRRR